LKQHVNISIYNQLGQSVSKLVKNELSAGLHKYTWNGQNDQGQPVPSGLYCCQIIAGNYKKNIKMLLVR
jgi:flagellar hook assembly protein FlgD